MTAFKFRLQPLLDLKLKEEAQANELVAQRQKELRGQQEKLSSLMAEKDRIKRRTQEIRGSFLEVGLDGAAMRSRVDYLHGLQEDLLVNEQRILDQKTVVEAARACAQAAAARAAECSRGVQILEKYRDKVKTKFLREIARKEELELDEIGMVSFLGRGRAI